MLLLAIPLISRTSGTMKLFNQTVATTHLASDKDDYGLVLLLMARDACTNTSNAMWLREVPRLSYCTHPLVWPREQQNETTAV